LKQNTNTRISVKNLDVSSRTVSVGVLLDVIKDGQSLTRALLNVSTANKIDGKDLGLVKELCYGTLRWYYRLNAIAARVLNKPLKNKDQDIHILILLGLYQFEYLSIPPHAVLSQTVETAKKLKKDWAKGLVNALLREYQRKQQKIIEQLDHTSAAFYAHPDWLFDAYKAAWPEYWQAILEANNQRPPMCLRVNKHLTDRETYLQELSDNGHEAQSMAHTEDGIKLTLPVSEYKLPGFETGLVSVQDGAAQLAAKLLELESDFQVLDACAAPGGKTCHILESQQSIKQLIVLDIDKSRVAQITQNLSRLQLNNKQMIKLIVGDASDDDKKWWDGTLFDRILLYAPCSATGVIRRHPDIKILRKAKDIDELVRRQASMLSVLWACLKPGGKLLYATCSILPEENHRQIIAFLQQHADAKEDIIAADWGHKTEVGRQILPGEEDMDGFFYARLIKASPD